MVFVVEAFLDNKWIVKMNNIKILTCEPNEEGVVFKNTKSYEGKANAYFTIIHDDRGAKYKLFYRASKKATKICLATSTDGLNFKKPNLKKIFHGANTNNNIIINHQSISDNFHVTKNGKDYIAISGFVSVHPGRMKFNDGVYLLKSKDGIIFKKIHKILKPDMVLKGADTSYFDSQNTIYWDQYRNHYRIFLRHNPARGTRSIQTLTTKDLKKFSKATELIFDNFTPTSKLSLYSNGICQYPESPNYIGLTTLQAGNSRETKKVTIIFSRDGLNFTKVINKPLMNNHYKDPYMGVCGIVTTKNKFFIYLQNMVTQHITAFSYRLHGINVVVCDKTGSILMKPIKLNSQDMFINLKTKARGYVYFELYYNNELIDYSKKIAGDYLNKPIEWSNGHILINPKRSYQIKIIMHRASLFSLKLDRSKI